MGKLTRGRTKYHTPAAKQQTPTSESLSSAVLSNNIPNLEVPDNLFSGLDAFQKFLAPSKALQESLDRDNEDARSTMSKKSFKSDMPFNKKDKRLLRREAFLSKLNAVRSAEVEEKKRKKRQKTVIVGDMAPMLDSLPSLTSLKKKVEKLQPTKFRSTPKMETKSLIHNERVAKYKGAFLNFCTTKKT